ncbi:substrate-binding domain-containing protein [Streptomyces sp. SID8377]|nr:substrate-binding domain-containing protein [Streptomyces sp. SID8377]
MPGEVQGLLGVFGPGAHPTGLPPERGASGGPVEVGDAVHDVALARRGERPAHLARTGAVETGRDAAEHGVRPPGVAQDGVGEQLVEAAQRLGRDVGGRTLQYGGGLSQPFLPGAGGGDGRVGEGTFQGGAELAQSGRGHGSSVGAGCDRHGAPSNARVEISVDVAVRHVRALVEEHGVHAVLMHGDELAVMVVSRLKALGLRVPEDLAFVVYDDQAAGLADPPLTAVAAPKREVGEAAVALLLERVAAGGASSPRRHVDLLPSLRVRSSCGAA